MTIDKESRILLAVERVLREWDDAVINRSIAVELQNALLDLKTAYDAELNEASTESKEMLAVLRMEREWLLGAWAAMAGIPQAQAEAEMLVASEKWRGIAVAESSKDQQ
jgi:hypothetical protein